MTNTISLNADDIVGALIRQSEQLTNYLRATPPADFDADMVVNHIKRMREFADHVAGLVKSARDDALKKEKH